MRLIGFVVLVLFCALDPAMSDTQSKFSFAPLPNNEVVRLNKQREFVVTLVSEHMPDAHLTRSKTDFAILQKIVDLKIIQKDETWKLQSLGVVFGDALISTIDGLAWWEITDEYGTDPTLRYRQTTLRANALTMISKRVEDGREINVQEMADWLAKSIHEKSLKSD